MISSTLKAATAQIFQISSQSVAHFLSELFFFVFQLGLQGQQIFSFFSASYCYQILISFNFSKKYKIKLKNFNFVNFAIISLFKIGPSISWFSFYNFIYYFTFTINLGHAGIVSHLPNLMLLVSHLQRISLSRYYSLSRDFE
jgi:hypothetical protein